MTTDYYAETEEPAIELGPRTTRCAGCRKTVKAAQNRASHRRKRKS